MVVYNVYDQIAELIANLNPVKVMGLKADEELQIRFENLVRKSKDSQLDVQEKDELDHIIVTHYDNEKGTQMHHLSPKRIKKGQRHLAVCSACCFIFNSKKAFSKIASAIFSSAVN